MYINKKYKPLSNDLIAYYYGEIDDDMQLSSLDGDAGDALFIWGGPLNPYFAKIIVPTNALDGLHYLWVKNTQTNEIARSNAFYVGDGVSSHYEIYWDLVQDWDGASGRLDATFVEGGVIDPSVKLHSQSGTAGNTVYVWGGFDDAYRAVITIPESTNGDHYIWVKNTLTGAIERSDAYSYTE